MHTRIWHKRLLIILLLLGLLRLAGLYFSPLGLHGDEAQYWAWSRKLDFGYYSKPPIIAWVIALTTSLFGNAEWAVRISSPLLHPIIAYVLFHIGKTFYDKKTGFWAAIIYFTMPAVWLSSGIVSTDVPLLLFWSLAVLAFAKLRKNPSWLWAFVLGLSIGFGLLSKYAMLFFMPALLLAILFDKASREAVISKRGLLVSVISVLIITPNIIWNKKHDFATISHTAANANLKGVPFHPRELLDFIASQFGVFGPVLFALFVVALLSVFVKSKDKRTMLLSYFAIVPLLIISLEALLSRANANWAVTSYIAASVLVAVQAKPKWIKLGVVINIIIGSIIALGGLSPKFADSMGQANAFKRLRAWPETSAAIIATAKAGYNGQPYSAIATDNRLVFYDLLYYGVEEKSGIPLAMWLLKAGAHNHAEATKPLPASDENSNPVLIVNHYKDYEDKFRADFKRLEYIGKIETPLGGGKTRTLYLWAGWGYSPTTDPNR